MGDSANPQAVTCERFMRCFPLCAVAAVPLALSGWGRDSTAHNGWRSQRLQEGHQTFVIAIRRVRRWFVRVEEHDRFRLPLEIDFSVDSRGVEPRVA